MSCLQLRCNSCHLVSRKHFSYLLHFCDNSESHLVCSHYWNLFLLIALMQHTCDNLIHSRNKEQHDHHTGRCQYAFGHFTCNLMYLFFNLDLGGITKLPTEAELQCTSGDTDSSNENRTNYNSLPINNSSLTNRLKHSS